MVAIPRLTGCATTVSNPASSISLQKRFNNLPFSLSMNINHRQDLNKETVSMTLPTLAINMNRLTPFRNLSNSKSMEWLTRLGLNYSAQASNRLETIPDSIFLPVLLNWGDSSLVRLPDSTLMRRRNSSFYRNGMEHRASASTTIKLFKYIRITQRLTRLSRTISRSAKDTLTYGGILFIFISGFAVSAPPVVTLLRSRHAIAGDGVSCVWL